MDKLKSFISQLRFFYENPREKGLIVGYILNGNLFLKAIFIGYTTGHRRASQIQRPKPSTCTVINSENNCKDDDSGTF